MNSSHHPYSHDFSLSRTRDSWDRLHYTCSACGNSAPTSAEISHASHCTRSTITDLPDTLSQETREDIQGLFKAVLEPYTQNNTPSHDELIELLESDPRVNWTQTGSSARIIASIGLTNSKGTYHTTTRKPLVLKIDPKIRYDTSYTPVSSNIDERATYEKAIATGTDCFFATIYATVWDASILIMEQVIPIDPVHRKKTETHDRLWDPHREYINPFLSELSRHGWQNPDWKHGNIGHTRDNNTVILDYGTGPELQPTTINTKHVQDSIHEAIPDQEEFTTQTVEKQLSKCHTIE